jgi:asparagine synthase (glutamine-hydrolysing)
MCGIGGVVGEGAGERAAALRLRALVRAQRHRGPDSEGLYFDPAGGCGLGHNRLSIIDLSTAGSQPLSDRSGSLWLVFNGEIYNYRELRAELRGYPFRTSTDSEVILAAYEKWGPGCLERFVGMFAFVIWDERERVLFAARDRFGVKPLYYHLSPAGELLVASEVAAFARAGVPMTPDASAWSSYFAYGLHDHTDGTFWAGIRALPAGHTLRWRAGKLVLARWYDLADRIGPEYDCRDEEAVAEEYAALLAESIRLRFRSDVPVGIAISGGLDSSTLFGLVRRMGGREKDVQAFTYITGDPNYDELPWVRAMLAGSAHPLVISRLAAEDVPALAASVEAHQAEPFGGIPTLAYAKIFESARACGVKVLLDGQGMDEQWAGYDYYERLAASGAAGVSATGPVQGSRQPSLRPDCLTDEFRACAARLYPATPFPDALRNRQYQDIRYSKMPRALRFNDRISMRSSIELREPFLDHRLFELALAQPVERKLANGQRKVLLRRITRDLLPGAIVEAPKRPVQTPQREWLAGPLRDWAQAALETALAAYGGEWLDGYRVRTCWCEYQRAGGDNSFYLWQWISLGLMLAGRPAVAAVSENARGELVGCGRDGCE